MQDQIFNFLILIISSEQHDHTATEQHRGTQDAEGTRRDRRRLDSFPAFQGFRNTGTSPAVWDGLNLGQSGFSLASGSSSPHSTQHSGTSAAGMGNGEGGGAGGEEKGQAGVLPL